MVNIYDVDNTISYSFDQGLIGIKDIGGTAYHNAVAGNMSSNLIQRGNFWENLLGFTKESRLVTIAPLRAEKQLPSMSGHVLGVVEIVQDLSDEYETIFKFQISVIITCTTVMGLLFLVLLFP